jgi:hypothetical protein
LSLPDTTGYGTTERACYFTLTLADVLRILAFVFIFLTLAESTLSLHLYNGASYHHAEHDPPKAGGGAERHGGRSLQMHFLNRGTLWVPRTLAWGDGETERAGDGKAL